MYNVTTMGKDTDMGRQDTVAATMEKDRDTAAADMVAAATTKRLEKFLKIATNYLNFLFASAIIVIQRVAFPRKSSCGSAACFFAEA